MSSKKYGRAWTRIRARYVKKHPFCENCTIRGLRVPVDEVHHIVPISEGGDHSDENLIALCKSCHKKIHVAMDEFKE